MQPVEEQPLWLQAAAKASSHQEVAQHNESTLVVPKAWWYTVVTSCRAGCWASVAGELTANGISSRERTSTC